MARPEECCKKQRKACPILARPVSSAGVKFLADLHIHTYLSRATSRDLTLEHLHGWAQRKGITVVGTGDFTHPRWLAELREKLVPAEDGLFALREDLARAVDAGVPAACRAPMRFLLSVEVSSIYKRAGRVRKVHNLAYAPTFEVAASIAAQLARIGNIGSDGRPILGLDSRDFLEIVLSASRDAFVVPAHIWTACGPAHLTRCQGARVPAGVQRGLRGWPAAVALCRARAR